MKHLTIEQLSIDYSGKRVVHSVDLTLGAGEILGLVGESGSGKSTLARAICGLAPPSAGRILLGGVPLRQRRHAPNEIQMVFQNPAASLNPRRSIGQSIGEAIERRVAGAQARNDALLHYLDLVGLSPHLRDRRPGELSGGQKQRVAIARALAAEPALLIADEITSALDLSVQASILNLVADLRRQLGLGVLFISHNLAAVRYLCDRTAVMFDGRIIEEGASDALIRNPREDYTRALVEAVPKVTRHH